MKKPKECACGHPTHNRIVYTSNPKRLSYSPYLCKCCIAVDRYIRSSPKPPSQDKIKQFRLEASLKLRCFPYEDLNVNII